MQIIHKIFATKIKRIEFNFSILSFFILLASTQLQYLLSINRSLIVTFGLLLFIMSIFNSEYKRNIKLHELYIYSTLLYGLGLTSILFAIELIAKTSTRYLPIFWITQLVLTVIIFKEFTANRFEHLTWVLIITFMLETLIVMGQISYRAGYIGFEKVVDIENDVHAITGSMTNPNDFSSQLLIIALSIIYIAIMKNERYKVLFACLAMLPMAYAGGSRTIIMIAIGCAVIFFLWYIANKKTGFLESLFACIFIAVAILFTYSLAIELETDNLLSRTAERLDALQDISFDESIDFRLIALRRLYENFFNLNFGTFSDLQYGVFFTSRDHPLMKNNPHSLIVELSFLFGYAGFAFVLFFFGLMSWGILKNKNMNILNKFIFLVSLFAIQAVSASNMQAYYLFIPFLLIYSSSKTRFL